MSAAHLPRPLLMLVWILLSTRASLIAGTAAGPPNIVIVLSDDHTCRDSSVYGSPDIVTPNMQRLAKAGMTFDRAYVASPSCAPSRAALLTGLYPARNGAEANHSRIHKTIRGLPEYLREAGYEIAAFGKVAHYRHTAEYGFDIARHFNYHEDVAVEEAINWLRNRKSSRPLCLLVGTNWPHVPWPEDIGDLNPQKLVIPPNHVDNPASRLWRARYVAAIRAMDEDLGKVYDAAREVLGESTFFMHTSDHGAQWPFGKWTLYEDGIRTPMIVAWPGHIPSGVRSGALVSWIDVLPTLLDVAGCTAQPHLDGRSLLPVLLGRSHEHRRAIFAAHSGDGDFNVYPTRAVRTADGWKYIRNLHPEFRFGSHITKTTADNGYWTHWLSAASADPRANDLVRRYQERPAEELYHIESDPFEQTNLVTASQHQPQLTELRKKLDQWIAETGDTQTVYGPPELLPDSPIPTNQFVNPIGEGADPWVVRDPAASRYLWCMPEGNRAIAIHASESLASMGRKQIVWQAPDSGPVSQQIWAPELHFLDNRWHIYFAASDGKNENHLAWVLQSKSSDPFSPYELHGPFATGEGPDGRSPNIWAIDMTVLELNGKRFAVWSGWDRPGSDQQYLYIAPMLSPVQLAGPRIRLCSNDDFLWERIEPGTAQRGLNEAPQVFQSPSQTSLVFSCGASWLPTYKLGLLELIGSDPLLPASWKKRHEPVFTSTETTFGIGHSCFVKSLDDRQWWHIYHAKLDRNPGWRRAIFAQPMQVGPRGFPVFGTPIEAGRVLPKPSGDMQLLPPFSTAAFDYYGHHQFFSSNDNAFRLGHPPSQPINEYRSGEKIIFTGSVPADIEAAVQIDFHGDSDARDAGILFRTTGPALGYDAQRGYFAGLIPRTQLVILGRTDGSRWTELARAASAIDSSKPQRLSVRVEGSRMSISHNGQQLIKHTDETWSHGQTGLRVVDTAATFSQLSVTPISTSKSEP
jgi:arylsulfatase A-like enzyme/GH43 family beta-xylosidase